MESAKTFVATTSSKEELYEEWFKPPYSWFKFEDDDQVLVRYEKVFEHPGCAKRTEVMDITTFKLCYRKWILEEDFDPNEPEEEEEFEDEDPVVTCDCFDVNNDIPVGVSTDLNSPIAKQLEKDDVKGLLPTITWFIKHMIPVTVIVNFRGDDGSITQRNIYKKAILVNLESDDQGDPILIMGTSEECEIKDMEPEVK